MRAMMTQQTVEVDIQEFMTLYHLSRAQAIDWLREKSTNGLNANMSIVGLTKTKIKTLTASLAYHRQVVDTYEQFLALLPKED